MTTVRIDKIPKDSRLGKYLEELPEVAKRNPENLNSYIHSMFIDCLTFIKSEVRERFPDIQVFYVPNHADYERLAKENEKYAVQEEIAKLASLAFTIGNRFNARSTCLCADEKRGKSNSLFF